MKGLASQWPRPIPAISRYNLHPKGIKRAIIEQTEAVTHASLSSHSLRIELSFSTTEVTRPA